MTSVIKNVQYCARQNEEIILKHYNKIYAEEYSLGISK